MAKGKLFFKVDRCKGCENCVGACPKDILTLDNDVINSKGFHPVSVTDEDECIACGNCAMMCPDLVIRIEKID